MGDFAVALVIVVVLGLLLAALFPMPLNRYPRLRRCSDHGCEACNDWERAHGR